MILVDTSVWIELLAGNPRRAIREEDLLRFATCGPIIQEVLQGLKPGLAERRVSHGIPGDSSPQRSDPTELVLFGNGNLPAGQASRHHHPVVSGLPDRRNRDRSWNRGVAQGPRL